MCLSGVSSCPVYRSGILWVSTNDSRHGLIMHIFLVLLVYAGVTVNGSILDFTCDQNDPYQHLMQQGECAGEYIYVPTHVQYFGRYFIYM